MRKKQLLTLLHQSVEKNGALELRLKELEEAIAELKTENEELSKKSAESETKIEELLDELEKRAEQPINSETVLSEPDEMPDGEEMFEEPSVSEAPAETKRTPVVTEDGSIDVTALQNIPINKEMKYASEAIGEIVVKCAAACNEFAKSGGSGAREYINLALGRTEVFKADCLTIASSDTAFSVKKECIDRIRRDTEDYFKGLCESINN